MFYSMTKILLADECGVYR